MGQGRRGWSSGAGRWSVEGAGGSGCRRTSALLKSAKRLCGRAAKTKRTSWTSPAEPAWSAKSAKHEQPQYRIEASGTAPFATAAGAQRQQKKMILALQACMSSLHKPVCLLEVELQLVRNSNRRSQSARYKLMYCSYHEAKQLISLCGRAVQTRGRRPLLI